MKKLLLILILFAACIGLISQTAEFSKKGLVTIPRETRFVDAVNALEVMSQQYANKKIINSSSFNQEIGIPIKEILWREALTLIISYNNLVLEELPGALLIKDFTTEKEEEKKKMVFPDTKQIKISSIFFKVDKSFLNSIGIDWSTLYKGRVDVSLGFMGASNVSDELLTASASHSLESSKASLDLNTLLKIIEAKQKGTIIARPNIVVISGKEGFIQVGQDFSVKTTDEDGNVFDRFFSTGIIMKVLPEIVEKGGTEAIYLKTMVEKSDATPGELSTIINKSTSTTEVLLFDGEETVIAGLYDTDETKVRSGIPILKDLPWWVFGIRYLTGYNRSESKIGEMIIVIKAEIVESLDERINKTTTIKEKVEEHRDSRADIKTYFEENDEDMFNEKK